MKILSRRIGSILSLAVFVLCTSYSFTLGVMKMSSENGPITLSSLSELFHDPVTPHKACKWDGQCVDATEKCKEGYKCKDRVVVDREGVSVCGCWKYNEQDKEWELQD